MVENYQKIKKFLMTQSFVSRKHMEYFGFYFPPEIKIGIVTIGLHTFTIKKFVFSNT